MSLGTFPCPHCHAVFQAELLFDEIVNCPHCNSVVMLARDQELAPGELLGDFQIVSHFGRSDLGDSFLVRSRKTLKLSVMKVLAHVLSLDDNLVQQFRNKTKMSGGRDSHPNIIHAVESHQLNDIDFLVSSEFQGSRLQRFIVDSQILSETVALECSIKLAEILSFAWENHGYIHQSLNPGNIVLDNDEQVFLLDMGILQHLFDGMDPGMDVSLPPFYLSPEQVTRKAIDWSSDQYSLGATLYHLLTGYPPYDSADFNNILSQHVNTPFPEPALRSPGLQISPSTVSLLRKMMAKNPEDRYPSWDAFKKATSKILAGLKNDGVSFPKVDAKKTTKSNKSVKPEKSTKQSKAKVTTAKVAAAKVAAAKVAAAKVPKAKVPKAPKVPKATSRSKSNDISRIASRTGKHKAYRKSDEKPNMVLIIGGFAVLALITIFIVILIFLSARSDKEKKIWANVKYSASIALEKTPPDYKGALSKYKYALTELEGGQFESKARTQCKKYSELYDKQQRDFKEFDEKYGKMKEDAVLAAELIEQAKKDESLYEKALESLNKVLQVAKPMKKVVDPQRNNRLAIMQIRVERQVKKLKSLIQTRNDRLAEEERMRQMEQTREKLAKEQHIKKISDFRLDLVRKKNQIRLNFLQSCIDLDFDKARQDPALTEDVKPIDEELSNEVMAHNLWRAEIIKRANQGEAMWKSLYNSDKRWRGLRLRLPEGVFEILRIKGDEILMQIVGVSKISTLKRKISELSEKEAMPLLKKAAADNGGNSALAIYWLTQGKFKNAKNTAPPSEQPLISQVIQAFLKAKLIKASQMLDTPENIVKAKEEYNVLKKQYGDLSEFEEAMTFVNELNAKKGLDIRRLLENPVTE